VITAEIYASRMTFAVGPGRARLLRRPRSRQLEDVLAAHKPVYEA
jgi:hypothetical protein